MNTKRRWRARQFVLWVNTTWGDIQGIQADKYGVMQSFMYFLVYRKVVIAHGYIHFGHIQHSGRIVYLRRHAYGHIEKCVLGKYWWRRKQARDQEKSNIYDCYTKDSVMITDHNREFRWNLVGRLAAGRAGSAG